MAILFVVVVLLLISIIFIKLQKADTKKLKEQEEKLTDELIYDPLTGRKLTLEQAQNETLIYEDEGMRIKSDEEIEANYVDADKEIEYIRRESFKRNFVDNEDDSVSTLLQNAEVFANVDEFNIGDLWLIGSKNYIGLTYLSSNYDFGRSDQKTFEYQLIGVVHGESLCNQIKQFGDMVIQRIDEAMVFRSTKAAKYHDYLKLIGAVTGDAR
jgi:hypothetical protein